MTTDTEKGQTSLDGLGFINNVAKYKCHRAIVSQHFMHHSVSRFQLGLVSKKRNNGQQTVETVVSKF
jgi:hypothetical protein